MTGDARQNARGRGYFIVDVAFGLALVGVLIALLTAAVSQSRRASKALAAQREAVAAVELALAEMQAGGDAGEGIRVEALDAEAPEGWRWVRVTAEVASREAGLVGLVPHEDGGTP